MGIVPFHIARLFSKPDELVGLKEIHQMAGFSYWYARALASGVERSRPPFPEAYTKVGGRNFWKRKDVENWIKARDDLRQRKAVERSSDHP